MVARSSAIFSHAPRAMFVVALVGALTAFFAASIGLVQNDIKRVLAYSTVSQLGYMFLACGVGAFAAGVFHLMTHAFFKACLFLGSGSVIHAMGGEQDMGYVTIALAVFGREALAAAIVYFFAYLVSNAGAFAAVSALYRDETKPHPVALLAGEGRRARFASAVFALCLFSLAGIPATAGFIGKFFLFKAALERGMYSLAVIGVLNSLVSIGYYLKVVYILYMRDPIETEGPPPLASADRLALAICAAGIFALGIFPASLWGLARSAAASLTLPGP